MILNRLKKETRLLVDETLTQKDALKAGIVLAVAFFFARYAADPTAPHFIDAINLVIHEAGHPIFGFFGNFMGRIGGTLMQLLVPIAFVTYFWRRGDRYAAGLLLFWVGQNLINISIYARDAMVMQLPLLGGDAVEHDWNAILGVLHLTPYTALIANGILWTGYVTLGTAFGLSLWYSFNRNRTTTTTDHAY